MRHDVTFPLFIEVDEIYNLACPASPIHYQYDPVQTTKTSGHGRHQHARACQAVTRAVLQASTSEVYGDPTVHPQPESYWGNVNPIGVRSCYDEGKRCAETLFFDYYRQHSSKSRSRGSSTPTARGCTRPTGGWSRTSSCRRCRDEPITIYGDGRQTRSFCYVDDLMTAFLALMATPAEFTGPVNLGNPVEFRIRELAEKIVALTGTKSKIQYRPLPSDDPLRRKPDIALARKQSTGSRRFSSTKALRER